MSRITRVPFGFTDLIGSKNFGQNPAEMAQTVAPTIDIGKFLSIERRFHKISSAGVNSADGTFSTFTVPQGELWLVDSVGCQVVQQGSGGAGFCNFAAFLTSIANSDNGSLIHPLSEHWRFETPAGYIVGGAAAGFVTNFPNPVPVFSDEQILFQNQGGDYTSGKEYTTRASLRYLRLEV